MASALVLSLCGSGLMLWRASLPVVDPDPEKTAMDIAMRILMESAYKRQEGAGPEGADEVSVQETGPPVECAQLKNRKIITNKGNVTQSGRIEVKHSEYVFRYDDITKYAHMVTIETVPLPDGGNEGQRARRQSDVDNGGVDDLRGGDGGGEAVGSSLMFAAWQAAPLAPPNNESVVKMAVEGLPDQRIWYATSADGGKSWSAPMKAPIASPGALWSPVLHYDASSAKLWLLYSSSRLCRRPNPPNNWAPGGDIMAMTLSHIRRVHENESGKSSAVAYTGDWSAPWTVLAQSRWGAPAVIANKLLVTSGDEWVLPYWLERPEQETCTNMLSVDNGGEDTQAGVLISADHGGQWKAYKGIVDATGRARMLEPTVVEVPASGGGYTAWMSSDVNNVAQDKVGGGGEEGEMDSTATGSATALDPAVLALSDLAAELGVPGVSASEMGLALAEKEALGVAASTKPGTAAADAMAAAAEAGTKLIMFMRTDSGCMFHAVSYTGGRSWSNAQPYPLLCPNSKFHVIQLTGPLVVDPPPPPPPPRSPPPKLVKCTVPEGGEGGEEEGGGDCVGEEEEGDEKKAGEGNDADAFLGVGKAVASGAVTGNLAVVFNDHRKGLPEVGCRACRTHLHLAVSRNGGATWRLIGAIDEEVTNGVRIHYPTVMQIGRQLAVAYTRFYLTSELGLNSPDQGVKVVHLTFKQRNTDLVTRIGRDTISQKALEAMVDDYIRDTSIAKLKRLAEHRWPVLTAALAESFELESLGGAEYLKKKVRLARYMKGQIREAIAANATYSIKEGRGSLREQAEREAAREAGLRAYQTQQVKKSKSAEYVPGAVIGGGGTSSSFMTKAEKAKMLDQKSRKIGPYSEDEVAFQRFFGGGAVEEEEAPQQKRKKKGTKPLSNVFVAGLPNHIADQIRAQRQRHPHLHQA